MHPIEIERPVVIPRPSRRKALADRTRLSLDQARQNPRLLAIPAVLALAVGLSAVAAIDATRDEPALSLNSRDTDQVATAAVQPAVPDAVASRAEPVIETVAEAAEAMASAFPAATPSPITTGSVERPVDPAIAAAARMSAEPAAAEAASADLDIADLAQVAIAEDEEDVQALEVALVEQGSSGPFETTAETIPVEEEIAAVDVSAETTASIPAGMSPAWINSFVNLRTGPSNDSSVIRVLPTNAAVQATSECAHFCEVVHEGTRGYVYKSYLSR
jgi:hypothetical protein